MQAWIPLPVVVPLLAASLALLFEKLVPRRVIDVLAVLVTAAVSALCMLLARQASAVPLAYWFGGWTPAHGQVVGISFVVDGASAGAAAFITGLFALTFLYTWHYFEEVRAHFHALMLMFCAALTGFCLTHDLFNLFVWFETMSVIAFALTGYRLEDAALEGALNFTVTNTIGSFLMMAGVGVAYAATGALDMALVGTSLAQGHANVLACASFVLMSTALMIKAAVLPFHFWLPDAHAVAPTPVSVIFSSVMVPVGLFGLGRLLTIVFAQVPAVLALAHALWVPLGAVTAVVGGVLALQQTHLKRLLAYATISHVGVMLAALALATQRAFAAWLLYMLGHGMVKAALFMGAGMLAAAFDSVQESKLYGRARGFPLLGSGYAVAGVCLAGLPFGIMGRGAEAVEVAGRHAGYGWISAVLVVASALTGAAVLRVGVRVFLGAGTPVQEEKAAEEDESEHGDRPWVLMGVPLLLLVAVNLAAATPLVRMARTAAATYAHMPPWSVLDGAAAYAIPTVATAEAGSGLSGWIAVGLAMLIAATQLFASRLLKTRALSVMGAPLRLLRAVHPGRIGDQLAWLVAGLAMLTVGIAAVNVLH